MSDTAGSAETAAASTPLPAPTEALTKALATADVGLSADQVQALIAGVAAAPADEDAEAWMRLITPEPPKPLRKALATALETARAALTGDTADNDPIALLREEMAARGIDGFIVPRADEHQGEYVPLCAARLAWIAGFTGSAGTAVVLKEQAALFVDGRYTLQAATEVAGRPIEVVHLATATVDAWLAKTLQSGQKLGFDPKLHTRAGAKRLAAVCAKSGAELVPVTPNPLDAVWADRPPAPVAPVVAHDIEFSGRAAADKRTDIADALAQQNVDAAVISMPDSIAWLLNLRGGDVGYSPLPLSFAVLKKDASVDLYIDPRKLAPGLDRHLGNGVAVHPPEALGEALEALGAAKATVQADPNTASDWIFRALEKGGARIVEASDPCALPKAVKNQTELDGTRAAHRRDGAALTRFLRWLDTTGSDGARTEIEAADQLEAFRRPGDHFRGLSFPTISGAGSNGAIVHYRVTPETDKVLEPGSLYLVDSGAQYLDGTTDVTRTVAIGAPSDEMRDRFTRVLKGHIAIASARFPVGTSGGQLDTLARAALWQAGLDYDHGTGHGVGSYLGVHEGPQRISKAGATVPLQPGMIVSNEPGYYKTDAYGIRIENLVIVVECGRPDGGERDLLGFETLTHAPIDRRLVDTTLLTPEEIAWLDGYHADVRALLTPLLDGDEAAWLTQATAPLAIT
jgi:Xaa-Pro aminopeptidase